MAYTTINKSSDYFNTKLYTGNGGTQTITGVGFQPDFTWIKGRNAGGESHRLTDVVRGTGYNLRTNSSSAQDSSSNTLTSWNSDGFAVGANDASNKNTKNFASWNWKETATAGFDIVSYTGNGSAGKTVAHNLGVVPQMIIVKRYNDGTASWMVYHHKLGTTNPSDKYLSLDTTAAQDNGGWNSTMPTSSVFTVSADQRVNANGASYIAYVFAEKQGYSKFRSYLGNGSANGTFVYTGFKPAFVITKKINSTSVWTMFDNKRDPFNYVRRRIAANSSAVENTDDNQDFDILSNGFKSRRSAGDWNSNGDTFIYMAFAEAPLVGTNNVPCTAR